MELPRTRDVALLAQEHYFGAHALTCNLIFACTQIRRFDHRLDAHDFHHLPNSRSTDRDRACICSYHTHYPSLIKLSLVPQEDDDHILQQLNRALPSTVFDGSTERNQAITLLDPSFI